METPLRESASVTLNASGDGTARVGPQSAREIWFPEKAGVSASSNIKEATCTIYVGSDASAPNFRDQTIDGSSGDSTDAVSGDIIETGSYVWAKWSGGDNGARATVVVTGKRQV